MAKGALDTTAEVLVIIGAINWGLAVFNFNLVSALLGVGTLAKIVYALVGLSGLWMLVKLFK